MSLLDYEHKFSRLNINHSGGHASPHKIAMLLAVIDLIESHDIKDNEIFYSESLTRKFTEHFSALKSEKDRDNPHLPFFHLRSEDFWHHQIKPGFSQAYAELTTASGPGAIKKHIEYAYLDDELFELLSNQLVRNLLRAALFDNITITTNQRDAILNVGTDWNWLECEACVKDYFSMLLKQLSGVNYSKSQHREALHAKLGIRSEEAIESKHQNISAILIEMGQPYISAYKPVPGYQAQLKEAVFAHLAANSSILELFAQQNEPTKPASSSWEHVFDDTIPERLPIAAEKPRKYLARKINFSLQESRNRKLGEYGEKFVVGLEKFRLTQAGRHDLAEEVEWTSKNQGDGKGYDVRSFAWEEKQPIEKEHFIEVKTTNSGKYQPFYISQNEVEFSKERADQYSLYRVFDFKRQARIFRLTGAVDQHVHLHAKTYKASFGRA